MFKLSSLSLLYVSFFAMLGVAFLARVVNLHYNSPFNDEAIYVVLGRLGLFQGDWWLYNPSGWMAGQPYIYPPLSAIAYMTGGIVGSRFLNVLLGMLALEAMFVFTRSIARIDAFWDVVAAVIATTLLAFSTATLYVSRLATYDLPSFYFFLLSLIFLTRTYIAPATDGKYYFLGFLFLFFGFLTKITIGLYLPIFFIFSWYSAHQRGKVQLYYWKRYFAIPLLSFCGIYLLYNANNLTTYITLQAARDKNGFVDIWKTFWENTRYAWMLWALVTPVLLVQKRWRMWLSGSLLGGLIIVFHLATHREPTLDKHTFLTLMFLLPLVGIGCAYVIRSAPNRGARLLTSEIIGLIICLYCALSYQELRRFNMLWHDSTPVLRFLSETVLPGDKILAEVGASAILATYDKNFPTYTVTFDWFSYHQLSGEAAYVAAIKDGYFDLVEIDGGDQTTESIHSQLHNVVLQSLSGNYQNVYRDNAYLVYKRVY